MIERQASGLDRSRPAVVIDGGATGDIGVIRSLGLCGVPVVLLTSNLGSLAAASRYVSHCESFPPASAGDARRVSSLRQAVERLGARPVILATGDTALSFISRVRHQISEILDHDLPEEAVLESCMRKDRFALAARRLGLPTPPTLVPTCASAVCEHAGQLDFPVFVKPLDRADWDRLPPGIVTAVKGMRVNDAESLVRLFRDLEAHNAHRSVIQSYVPGRDRYHPSVHVYINREGRPLGAFSAQRARLWKPYAGMGCFVVSQRMPDLIRIAVESLLALDYTGFAIVQFKWDERRQQHLLLEINCRYSTWTELPSRSGCNFPIAAYATMTGQPPPDLVQKEGRAWIDLKRDLSSLRTYLRDGEWGLGSYLWSLARVRVCAYFALDDPGPFVEKILAHTR